MMKLYNFKKSGNIGHIYIFGPITSYAGPEYGEQSAITFREEFNQLEDSCDEIFIHINSPGGEVFEGLAICSLISSSTKPITTKNEGIAYSMAAEILCSSSNVIAYKNSLLMFHSASTSAFGTTVDLQEAVELLDKVDELLANIISSRSGKSLDEIRATYFDGKDHYLTAEEALREGFITSIEDKEAFLPQNISNFQDKKAVFAAFSDVKNFKMNSSHSSYIQQLINTFSPNSKKDNMEKIKALLKLDNKVDGSTVENAITAILKDRDDANGKVTDLTTKLEASVKQVQDLTADRDRLQGIVDKIPDGDTSTNDSPDGDPGKVENEFALDPVNAQARAMFNHKSK